MFDNYRPRLVDDDDDDDDDDCEEGGDCVDAYHKHPCMNLSYRSIKKKKQTFVYDIFK